MTYLRAWLMAALGTVAAAATMASVVGLAQSDATSPMPASTLTVDDLSCDSDAHVGAPIARTPAPTPSNTDSPAATITDWLRYDALGQLQWPANEYVLRELRDGNRSHVGLFNPDGKLEVTLQLENAPDGWRVMSWQRCEQSGLRPSTSPGFQRSEGSSSPSRA